MTNETQTEKITQEKDNFNTYFKEFKKAYFKGKLSLEDSHDYALRTTYLMIKQRGKD
jgi:hypothetical protein